VLQVDTSTRTATPRSSGTSARATCPAPWPVVCGSVVAIVIDGVLRVPFLDGVSDAPSYDREMSRRKPALADATVPRVRASETRHFGAFRPMTRKALWLACAVGAVAGCTDLFNPAFVNTRFGGQVPVTPFRWRPSCSSAWSTTRSRMPSSS